MSRAVETAVERERVHSKASAIMWAKKLGRHVTFAGKYRVSLQAQRDAVRKSDRGSGDEQIERIARAAAKRLRKGARLTAPSHTRTQ